jgi:membrane protein implicated in regulation of membrane protease activity
MLSMDNLPVILWFALTGALVIGEVFTTTFYLLALALGTLAAGALAYGGSPLEQQLGAAVLLSGLGAAIIWLNRRPSHPVDLNDPDIGQPVQIVSLEPLNVHYRGADWQAEFSPIKVIKEPQIGMTLHIQNKHGNVLLIG